MGTPKRHHYLPRFYLEKFSRDGLLWVYDRLTNEFRRQPPKDTAVELHRYSFRDATGQLDASMERVLSRFENLAAPAIAKVEAGGLPSKDERIAIAAFAAQINTRVPDSDKTARGLEEYFHALFRDVLERNPPTTRKDDALLSVDLPQGGKTPITREQIVKFMQRFEERAHDKKAQLTQMLALARSLTVVFANLDWVIVHTPPGKAFVLTDSPLVASPPPGWQPESKKTFGVATAGTKKLIPLSPNAGLFMYDKGGSFEHRAIYEPQLRQSNIALTSLCDRFVIARDEAHLRSLVRAARLPSRGEKPRLTAER